MDGKMEKSSGLTVYMAVMSTMIETVMFRASDKSSSVGGSGRIMAIRIPITERTIPISDESFRMPPKIPFLLSCITASIFAIKSLSTFYWRTPSAV